jgi:hypothetical protein
LKLVDLPWLLPLDTSTDSLLLSDLLDIFIPKQYMYAPIKYQLNRQASGPTSEPLSGSPANGENIVMVANLNGATAVRHLSRTDDFPESCRKPTSSLKFGGGRIPPNGVRMMVAVAEPKPHTCPTTT